MKNSKVRKLVSLAMLGSISYVLMVLNFPLPGFPTFLLIDFSDIPALIAALIFGPVAGIIVELIKNLLDYVMTGSLTGVPVGHIANLAAGVLFILPTYFVYKRLNSKKGHDIGSYCRNAYYGSADERAKLLCVPAGVYDFHGLGCHVGNRCKTVCHDCHPAVQYP